MTINILMTALCGCRSSNP